MLSFIFYIVYCQINYQLKNLLNMNCKTGFCYLHEAQVYFISHFSPYSATASVSKYSYYMSCSNLLSLFILKAPFHIFDSSTLFIRVITSTCFSHRVITVSLSRRATVLKGIQIAKYNWNTIFRYIKLSSLKNTRVIQTSAISISIFQNVQSAWLSHVLSATNSAEKYSAELRYIPVLMSYLCPAAHFCDSGLNTVLTGEIIRHGPLGYKNRN